MQSYSIDDYSVEFDRATTLDWYEKDEGWDCDCDDCQNFLALAKQQQLPATIIDLLHIFGALSEKPTYVCELASTKQGHLYQFHYRVAGRILNDFHPHGHIQFDWGSLACGHDSYPYGAPNFPKPHFDLMFIADLPIDEHKSK